MQYDRENLQNYTFSYNSKEKGKEIGPRQNCQNLKYLEREPKKSEVENGPDQKIKNQENLNFVSNSTKKITPPANFNEYDTQKNYKNLLFTTENLQPRESPIIRNQPDFNSRKDSGKRILTYPEPNVIGYMYFPKQVIGDRKMSIYLSRSCRGLRDFF